MIDQDWINARRAEITDQKEQAISIANKAFGALQLLDAVEAAFKAVKPDAPPLPPGETS